MPVKKLKSKPFWGLAGKIAMAVVTVIATGIAVYALDTLKTVVTQDSLDKELQKRGLTSDKLYIQGQAAQKVETTAKTVDEIKADFKEFKKDQDVKLKEFQDAQLEMMKLMIRMNAKLEVKDS
jgi:hypothetical protein